MGKYLAAVAIYTVALLFSAGCNFLVLNQFGAPDFGLLAASTSATGSAVWRCWRSAWSRSFLTSNITVGFVLGALVQCHSGQSGICRRRSEPQRRREGEGLRHRRAVARFHAGIVSLSGTAYFLLIVAVMLYIAMVLIGPTALARRSRRREHGAALLCPDHRIRRGGRRRRAVGHAVSGRADLTSEGLSTLSPSTVKLVNELDQKRPVHIEAFISPVGAR